MLDPTWEEVSGWAGACRGHSWVYRPRAADEVPAALAHAAGRGLTVVHRGAGLSYGDATLNEGGAVLDLTALRSMQLDPDRGVVRAGAGATIEDVWRAALPHGWWPPVVPGTMKATLGGCVAMDVHGKNHLQQGSFGEHVERLLLLEPEGNAVTLEAEADRSRMVEVIGAQGLTGTVLEVELRLERVSSGYLEVESRTGRSLDHMMDILQSGTLGAAHVVGWLDCITGGRGMGRGIVHFGRNLPSDHPLAGRGLTLADQRLPRRILGLIPRERAWWMLRPFANDVGMRAVNVGRYRSGQARSGRRYAQSHAAFHFLLDYVPGWQRAYGQDGFLQYQLFVPEEAAGEAFNEALRLQQASGVHAWLGVLKRHRRGRFAAPYSPDGYSLALDFPIRRSRASALAGLCRSYQDLLGSVGGSLYAAKDAVGVGQLPERHLPLFSSDLVRRWETNDRA